MATANRPKHLCFVALLRRRFPKVSVAYTYSAWYFCEILTLLLDSTRRVRFKPRSQEFPGDPNRQQAWIAPGRVEAFIFAAHGK